MTVASEVALLTLLWFLCRFSWRSPADMQKYRGCNRTEKTPSLSLLFFLNTFLVDFTLSNLAFLYFNCSMLDKTNVV